MLKNARVKKGLSQQELADKLNVTKSYISKLENRFISTNISVKLLKDLSETLDICNCELLMQFIDNCSYCPHSKLDCPFLTKKQI